MLVMLHVFDFGVPLVPYFTRVRSSRFAKVLLSRAL